MAWRLVGRRHYLNQIVKPTIILNHEAQNSLHIFEIITKNTLENDLWPEINAFVHGKDGNLRGIFGMDMNVDLSKESSSESVLFDI